MEVVTLAHFQRSSQLLHPLTSNSSPLPVFPVSANGVNNFVVVQTTVQKLGRSQFLPHLHNQSITMSYQFPQLVDSLQKPDVLLPQHCTTWHQARACRLGFGSCLSVALLPHSCYLPSYICVFSLTASGLYTDYFSSLHLGNPSEFSLENSYRKPP